MPLNMPIKFKKVIEDSLVDSTELEKHILEYVRLIFSNPDLTLNGYARDDYGSVLDGAGDRCDVAPGCNSIDMIANDMYEWELALMGGDVTLDGKNAGGLIGAAACISQSLVDSNEYTIIVSWQARTGTTDSANNTCGASGKKRRQVVVQAFIYNI